MFNYASRAGGLKGREIFLGTIAADIFPLNHTLSIFISSSSDSD